MSAAPRLAADPATQRRRRLQLAAALAALHVRTALVRDTSARRRQRVLVCGAARILTALGVRVRVVAPRTPWPRSGPCRLVVADDAGWLGDLALITAAPRTAEGWLAACARALPGAGRPDEPGTSEAVACPVAFRVRTAGELLDAPPRTVAEIVAAHGLVVEVHLLPALDLTADVPHARLAAAA